MTSAQRSRIRQAIDAHQRAQLAAEQATQRCAGCGCAKENNTIGCKACSDRHNRKRRRANPAYRELENWRSNERRTAKRRQAAA